MPIDSKTPDFLDDNIRSATVAKEMFAELGLEYVQVHWYGDNPDFNKEPDRIDTNLDREKDAAKIAIRVIQERRRRLDYQQLKSTEEPNG
jgi:sugar phosphate isomerase/epimerase|tara:strand:- start:1745 stop:2014 length:270 start_codon:yes stop_codon:yes gene_type:complete